MKNVGFTFFPRNDLINDGDERLVADLRECLERNIGLEGGVDDLFFFFCLLTKIKLLLTVFFFFFSGGCDHLNK